ERRLRLHRRPLPDHGRVEARGARAAHHPAGGSGLHRGSGGRTLHTRGDHRGPVAGRAAREPQRVQGVHALSAVPVGRADPIAGRWRARSSPEGQWRTTMGTARDRSRLRWPWPMREGSRWCAGLALALLAGFAAGAASVTALLAEQPLVKETVLLRTDLAGV